VSFRQIIGSGSTGLGIPYQGNVVTATGSIIYGNGYADANLTPPGGHGTGAANNFTGTLFQQAGNLALPSNTTRLEGAGLYSGNGDADNMDNFVGFHIHFSSPIPMHDFFMTDIDGLEYGFSFALNGTTVLQPTLTLGNQATLEQITHDFDAAAMDTAIANLTSGVDPGAMSPSSLNVARTLLGSNVTGDSPDGQVRFGYGGAAVTDLFFGWGFWHNTTSTGTQRSGVTGISVIEPTIVPEPSLTVLMLALSSVLLIRRRRA